MNAQHKINNLFLIYFLLLAGCNDTYSISTTLKKIEICESKGEYKEGLYNVDKLLKIDSSNSCLHDLRGRFLSYLLKDSEALEEFRISIKLNSRNTSAYYNLGFTYMLLEKYDSAILYFNLALDSKLYSGFKMEVYKKDDLNNISHKSVSDDAIRFQRGIAYYETDTINLAISDFEFCVLHNFQKAKSQMYLGVLYIISGDARGCKLLQEAVINNEDQAKLYLEKYCK